MEKKAALFKAAAGLFARNGFEATTTVQIARAAHATEPTIYYHFKGKDDLFTQILERATQEYFSRINRLPEKTAAHFEKIANLISLHFQFVRDMPDETYLIASTCPASLNDPSAAWDWRRLRGLSKRPSHFVEEAWCKANHGHHDTLGSRA